MGLRPPHVYRRLNRARLDSGMLAAHRPDLCRLFRDLERAHAAWEGGGSPASLAREAQRFIDFLSLIFLVPRKSLSLADRPRPSRRDGEGRLKSEIHGTCAPEGNIRIYLRTACRKKPTAFRTLFNTLIHEWVHHYDFEALGDSIHCGGFYRRIGSITDGLTVLEGATVEEPSP